MTTFFSRVGLGPGDVGLKVSSRKVLAAVLERFQVPPENFAQVSAPCSRCYLVPQEPGLGCEVLPDHETVTATVGANWRAVPHMHMFGLWQRHT